MSIATRPISPTRFSAALPDLPLDSLHAKAAEIRNGITHLQSSNDQLREYAEAGDVDCRQAIEENEEVIARMRHRLELLKLEVQGRGMMWVGDDAQHDASGASVNATATEAPVNGTANGHVQSGSGRFNDEELARRIREQMNGDDEGGVHL